MNSHLVLKNNVKEFRLKKGLSQSSLAIEVGTSKNTISCIERGQFCPSSYLAFLLCRVFECRFEDLFFLEV